MSNTPFDLNTAVRLLSEYTAQANRRAQADMAALAELLPTSTPGVRLLKITHTAGVPEVLISAETDDDNLFGMRMRTTEARATIAALREEFDGLATFTEPTK